MKVFLYFSNVLRSVLISVPFVMITYLFMNVSYLTTLTVSEMTSGVAVATLFGEKIFAPLVWIISLGVAISAAGCTLAFQFGITRYRNLSLLQPFQKQNT